MSRAVVGRVAGRVTLFELDVCECPCESRSDSFCRAVFCDVTGFCSLICMDRVVLCTRDDPCAQQYASGMGLAPQSRCIVCASWRDGIAFCIASDSVWCDISFGSHLAARYDDSIVFVCLCV